MSYIPNNYDMWARHDAEQEAELERMPKCYECGKPIQDEHLYEINDELICEKCLNKNYRKYTDDYVN